MLFCHKIQYIVFTGHNEMNWKFGPTRNCTIMSVVAEQKSFSWMLIFILEGTLINEIPEYRAQENVVLQGLMHPLPVSVWCDLWRGGIFGWYFFKNKDGATLLLIDIPPRRYSAIEYLKAKYCSHTFEKRHGNWPYRIWYCVTSCGSHINILFKKNLFHF